MSKIDFQKIVQNVLLEVTWLDQDQPDETDQSNQEDQTSKTDQVQNKPKTQGNYPQWFVDILSQHEKLGLGHVNNDTIRLLFNIGVKPYISQEEARQVGKYILILDVIKSLYEQVTPKPAKNINIFFSSPQINQLGQEMANEILTYTNKKQWLIQTSQVANAYRAVKVTPSSILKKAAGALGALRVGMGPVG